MGRRKRKRPKGFSEPWSKPGYDLFTDMLDVRGREKRQALNGVSLSIAGAAALSSAFGGCFFAIEKGGTGIVSGWIIGFFVGAIVFNVVMGWLKADRYYRP